MSRVDRFSVSLDSELLAAFDRHIAEHGYENRSEAVRDLIRDRLTATHELRDDEIVAATLSLVCDHRETESSNRLRHVLRTREAITHGMLVTAMDEHRDRVAVGLKGRAGDILALADRLQAIRGLTQVSVSTIPVAEAT